ncbi:hypothetical protein GUY61_10500 [Streptomyces sp. GC420]|nr:hypothetical protein [Streptomyces sp. GC420]NBM16062.1 hypothetical protein [Streptomyces sp. GC420]
MTDRSVVAACSLGASLRGTGVSFDGPAVKGLPGSASVRPVCLPLSDLPVRERSERPTEALAVAAAAQAKAYAFAANGAEAKQIQHHTMWAFRGPEPWSHPA